MIESFCCDFCQHAARGYRGLFPKRYSIRLYLARCIWVQTLTTVYLFFAISGMCFSQAQPRKDVALELVRSAVLRSGPSVTMEAAVDLGEVPASSTVRLTVDLENPSGS